MLQGLWCKHEGYRFEVGSFKPTGPVYAMLSVLKGEIKKATGVETVTTQDLINRQYESVTREVVVSAATSGNHGRALAWGARMFGCRCVIYMNDGVSAGREEAIATYGAEVVRVAGNYDQAVQRSYADAEMFGYFAISDEKSAEYPHISREIIGQYAGRGRKSFDSSAAARRPLMSSFPAAAVDWPRRPAGICGSAMRATIRG